MSNVVSRFKPEITISYDPDYFDEDQVVSGFDQLFSVLEDLEAKNKGQKAPYEHISDYAQITLELKSPVEVTNPPESRHLVMIQMEESAISKPLIVAGCHNWRIPFRAILSHPGGKVEVSVKYMTPDPNAEVQLVYEFDQDSDSQSDIKDRVICDLEWVIRELTEPCPQTEQV